MKIFENKVAKYTAATLLTLGLAYGVAKGLEYAYDKYFIQGPVAGSATDHLERTYHIPKHK